MLQHGKWMAAVLACGPGAVLSHESAGALWGVLRARPGSVAVSSTTRRGHWQASISHRQIRRLDPRDSEVRNRIPVTSLPRTLLDLAGVIDAHALRSAFEETDRLGLLELGAITDACGRARGRRGVGQLRALVEEAAQPEYTRSALEERFRDFCRDHCVPRPEVNAWVLGFEVDALWRAERVIVELDGWEYHRSRAAFERDRAKAAKLEVAGFLVYRLTHRRLEREPLAVAEDLLRALSNRANP